MSKNSTKTNYQQLMEWLPTLGRTTVSKKEQSQSNFSKTDYYKSKGVNGKNSN